MSLPADCLIGPLHTVWGVGMAVLASERGHIGTSVIGLERRPDHMAHLAEGRDLTSIEPPAADLAGRERQRDEGAGPASGVFDLAMLRGDLDGPEAMPMRRPLAG